MCALTLRKQMEDNNILDRAFSTFPEYNLVLTGTHFFS